MVSHIVSSAYADLEKTVKLAFTTPCLYPTADRVHFLHDSCKRWGVDLHIHGVGMQFLNWGIMTRDHTVPHLKELLDSGYTHVLYMDGIDSLLVAGENEIIAEYKRYGSPSFLCGTQLFLWPENLADTFSSRSPWKYPNAGSWIGELPYLIETWERLATDHSECGLDWNPQSWLVRAWDDKLGVLDEDCRLFQVIDRIDVYFKESPIIFHGDRVANNLTFSLPCVLHFPGGYADPNTGRDYRMGPVFKQLFGDNQHGKTILTIQDENVSFEEVL